MSRGAASSATLKNWKSCSVRNSSSRWVFLQIAQTVRRWLLLYRPRSRGRQIPTTIAKGHLWHNFKDSLKKYLSNPKHMIYSCHNSAMLRASLSRTKIAKRRELPAVQSYKIFSKRIFQVMYWISKGREQLEVQMLRDLCRSYVRTAS